MSDARAALKVVGILVRLLDDGLITVSQLRKIIREHGATLEELSDLDRRLAAAIVRRAADVGS